MQIYQIKSADTVDRGEYLYHFATKQIVICSNIRTNDDEIKIEAFANGRLMVDKLTAFRKIKLEATQSHARAPRPRPRSMRVPCSSCKSKNNNKMVGAVGKSK